jgi:hypothetical protein
MLPDNSCEKMGSEPSFFRKSEGFAADFAITYIEVSRVGLATAAFRTANGMPHDYRENNESRGYGPGQTPWADLGRDSQ